MAESETVRLSLLGSQREYAEDDLAQLYDYPDQPDDVWVRANFVSSLDGGATVDGASGALGGPGDRFVFNMLREIADIIVVGAGTVRAEGYSGAHLSPAQRQRRQARGQSEVPQIAIVTKAGRLERDMPVFARTEVPPLVLTCAATAEQLRERLSGLAEVVDCSGEDPDVVVAEASLLAALRARGLRRILVEGGPTLLGSFIECGLLDEMCLTIAPYVIGGAAKRIAMGATQLLTKMRRVHVLTDDDGYLYTRYVRA